MNKKDWFYSGIIACFLLLMILSNIALIFLLLSQSYVWIVFYGIGIAILFVGLIHRFYTRWGFSMNQEIHWIKNHLIFWILTDYHFLILLARYLHPKDRPHGWIPELLFGIHLILIIPVYLSQQWAWFKKHELLWNIILHVIVYTMISYNFIQFVIQTMQ